MIRELNGLIIEGSDRNIGVKYTRSGDAYFNFNGKRFKLSDIERVRENTPGAGHFDGVMYLSAFSGLFVKVADNGEAVKVYTYRSK